ncbi:family 43 glycosylhydrolase [Paenarthrobacter sp. NPDC018779]|uniref:family 43 glycosylhydrolase n=1 Tax=Paenarthrobacter sp. NPDC018779 TaxID=3364375 RepID=UPI0037C6A3CC
MNAHGACLLEEDGRYYLFGEYKTDDVNEFAGFSCYSSEDLANWRFEKIVLPRQADGLLGPGRVGERVKVMRSASTGRYSMYFHSDNGNYQDPIIGLATSDTITGDYAITGPLTFKDQPIRRWDIGSFQDDDGTAYLLVHEGDIYRLSPDLLTAEELVTRGIAPGGESPTMVKTGGTYFMLFSHKTSWESNDNFHLSAPSLNGPWTYQGVFAPDGSQTCNSQSTFSFQLTLESGKTLPIYMGDRWSYPHQASAATYVWQPLTTKKGRLEIATFASSWNPKTGNTVEVAGPGIKIDFESDLAGETLEVPFDGSGITLMGTAQPNGAYACIDIMDSKENCITSSYVSFYAKVPEHGYRYVSPQLTPGTYRLVLTVDGALIEWSDKRGERFGSAGTKVSVTGLTVHTPKS